MRLGNGLGFAPVLEFSYRISCCSTTVGQLGAAPIWGLKYADRVTQKESTTLWQSGPHKNGEIPLPESAQRDHR